MKYSNLVFFFIMSLLISYTLNKSLIKNKINSKHKTQNIAMINAKLEAGTKVRSKTIPESERKKLDEILVKHLFSKVSDDDDEEQGYSDLVKIDCKGILTKALEEKTKLSIDPSYFRQLLTYKDLERDILLRVRIFFKEQTDRNIINCTGRLITKDNGIDRYVKEYEKARQEILKEVDDIIEATNVPDFVPKYIITGLLSTHRDLVDEDTYKKLNHG